MFANYFQQDSTGSWQCCSVLCLVHLEFPCLTHKCTQRPNLVLGISLGEPSPQNTLWLVQPTKTVESFGTVINFSDRPTATAADSPRETTRRSGQAVDEDPKVALHMLTLHCQLTCQIYLTRGVQHPKCTEKGHSSYIRSKENNIW